MIVKKNKNLVLLAGCIAIWTFALTGCRSGGFPKPNFPKPNLSALKFWKSPDAVAANTTKVPPPPARYFDPAPILEEQIAKAKAGADENIELNGQRFNEELRQSYAQHTNGLNDGVNANARSLADVVPNTQLNGSLSNAQQEFKAAMQDNLAKADSVEKAAADLKSLNAQPSFNQSLTGLNKSMYDANGKLVNNTQQVKDSVLKKLDQTKNSFPVATKSPENSVNQFIAATKEKTAELSTLKADQFDFKAPPLPKSAPIVIASPSDTKTIKPPSFMSNLKTQPVAAASDAQLRLVQAQVADANRQIELLKQQVAQSMRQRPAPVQTPIQTPVQTPIAAPVAAPPVAAAAPAQRVAQLKTPRFGTSSYSAANYPKPVNPLANVSPTNILRANEPLRSKPAEPASTGAAPAFPSTPHGNFAPQGNFGASLPPKAVSHPSPTFTPQPVAPVNFQTNEFQANEFQFNEFASGNNSLTLQGRTVSPPPQPAASVGKIKSHMSNVDIPASILNGSGSYAPGSVHQVGQ